MRNLTAKSQRACAPKGALFAERRYQKNDSKMQQREVKTFEVHSPKEMAALAPVLLAAAGSRRKWAFQGSLGAGKTTLIQALCKALGVTEAVTSPTFALVNEYVRHSPEGLDEPVHHLDLYRIGSLEEALALDVEELLLDPYYTFIEWPECIEVLLPEDVVVVRIEHQGGSARKVLFL